MGKAGLKSAADRVEALGRFIEPTSIIMKTRRNAA